MVRRRTGSDVPEEFSGLSAGGSSDLIEYDPDAPDRGAASAIALADAGDSDDTIAVRPEWRAAQEALEQALGGPEAFAAAATQEVSDYRQDAEAMVGTGIGFRRSDNGLLTADVSLKVYVTEKVPGGRISSFGVMPQSEGGLPVEVEEVGSIIPQIFNRRYPRPVRCGVSVGHPLVTAGTLGCLVVLNNNRLCLLSNNHVIANSNNARLGDPILQPGKADGGLPADQIAVLENFVRLNFPGPNRVDAAVGWTSFRFVDPQMVTYVLNPTPVAARLGMTVKKNGRTTQATVGTVTDVSVNISVGYSGGVAQFRDQLGIRGVGGVFSRPGDSGSLITTANTSQPVGLLFAGRTDNSLTFANPIAAVIEELGIRRFVAQAG